MSQIAYRGNLSTKAFPFLTDFQGRTVIVPGPDNTFNRSVVSLEDQDRDAGIPIVFYVHNVMPGPFGFQSIGYETVLQPLTAITTSFRSIELVRSNKISTAIAGPRVYLSPQTSGNWYVFSLGAASWSLVGTSLPFTDTTLISYATVQGITYIFLEGTGCYKYNSGTNTFTPVTLTGLTAANILGIAAFQGYLIAYDTQAVYWSSTLDIDYAVNAVDFVPSLTTGAGNLTLEGARGPINFMAPATFGLAVYTTSNIVSAVYSGNVRYPFNFREIVASGGCTSPDLVSYDANTGNQYAYTTSGMQALTATATNSVFPEVTDFLAGQNFEDFDEVTRTFSFVAVTNPMQKRLVSIADRYLVFSYGRTSLTHAIVYDMSLKRYGKFKIAHVDCFEFEYLDPALADAPRKSIAFLKQDGSVSVVNLSVNYASSSGVLLVGKFQYARSRLLSLQEVSFQNTYTQQAVKLYDYASVSGGTLDSVTVTEGYDVSGSAEEQRSYLFNKVALNHSLLFVGGFALASFVLTFKLHGGR